MEKLKLFFVVLLTTFIYVKPAMGDVRFDFDGDRKTDPTVVNAFGNQLYWFTLKSSGGVSITPWGDNDGTNDFIDYAACADYDGDGKTDIAIWREPIPQPPPPFGEQAYFYILYSSTGTYDVIPWGRSGNSNFVDFPVKGDYDGDGKMDIAISRQTLGGVNKKYFYIIQSRDGVRVEQFGNTNDSAAPGDYDGDGKTDLVAIRPQCPGQGCVNTFYIQRSSDGAWHVQQFGFAASDYPIPADYDGDGKTDIAAWRGKSSGGGNGTWTWIRSSDGVVESVRWGFNDLADAPAVGDYDSDGIADLAIYRVNAFASCTQPSYFWIRGSSMGVRVIHWGSCHGHPFYNN